MRRWGRMCVASITRMTRDALRGHDEPASNGNAADPDACAPCCPAAARPGRPVVPGAPAPADDADAGRLVGLALGRRLPAVPRPAVGSLGPPPDPEHAARLGPGLPGGR